MRSPGSPQHHYVNLLFPLDALSISDLSCSALVCSHFECDSVPTAGAKPKLFLLQKSFHKNRYCFMKSSSLVQTPSPRLCPQLTDLAEPGAEFPV
ncbi:hypothetical protein AV530_000919 [Patagioenas fasciata monilis]|uniref:Uncharacterized protein n=1 Tax=Patagioenas fasciata monilis TaxID=372326 RepID=A0A1V4KSN0_PATFA|nr:hypothetical protein AV530_000919 [Patagioenas fasciata monilis]